MEGGCGQVRQLGQVAADEAAVGVEVQRFGKRVVQTADLLPIVVIDLCFFIVLSGVIICCFGRRRLFLTAC